MEILEKIHRNNDQIDFKKIWQEGVFVFDSNVLLDLYRLPLSAKEDLFSILTNENFNDRIWIGFQVILEFLNNRFEVIGDQKNKFSEVIKIVKQAIDEHEKNILDLQNKLSSLKLKERHSLIDPDNYVNDKNKSVSGKFLKDFITHLEELEKKQSDVNENDSVKNQVLKIFKEKIGSPFTKEILNEIYSDGERRYKNEIPPGYKDFKKEGSHFYEDKEFIRKFGDLILWKEIIEKSKKEKLKYIVLVTGDVKEDWWLKRRGKKLGARSELLNEIYSQAPELDTFYLYDTSSFLKYAKQEIDDKIKDSSIEDTQKLIQLSNDERNSKIKNRIIKKLKQKHLQQDLDETMKELENLTADLKSTNEYLKRLSTYRDGLYDDALKTNSDTEYAHNLGYHEAEYEDHKEKTERKIQDLEMKKSDLLRKYKNIDLDD